MDLVNNQVTPKGQMLKMVREWLYSSLGNSFETLLPELSAMFLEDGPDLISSIKKAIIEQDAIVLKESAHTLKGSSASMGLSLLANYAQSMEKFALMHDFAKAATQLPKLEGEFNQAMGLFSELV